MIKRDGERQRFDRAKLRAALLGAAHKRPVIASDIEAIVDRVELAAADGGRRAVLGADRRALPLESFNELDRGAYLQFAGTLPSISIDPEASDPVPAAGRFRPRRARGCGVHP